MWCGTRDGALLIINAESGRIQKVVRAHQKGGISVLRIFFFLLHLLDLEILAILGVGSWVMTGSADGWLKVWAADAQEARLFALCHKLFFCEMVIIIYFLSFSQVQDSNGVYVVPPHKEGILTKYSKVVFTAITYQCIK